MPPISLRYTPPYKLHLRKGKYYVSVIAPDEIKHFYADGRSRRSTGTNDQRIAHERASQIIEQILDDFDVKMSQLDPFIEALRPYLVKAGMNPTEWYRKGKLSVTMVGEETSFYKLTGKTQINLKNGKVIDFSEHEMECEDKVDIIGVLTDKGFAIPRAAYDMLSDEEKSSLSEADTPNISDLFRMNKEMEQSGSPDSNLAAQILENFDNVSSKSVVVDEGAETVTKFSHLIPFYLDSRKDDGKELGQRKLACEKVIEVCGDLPIGDYERLHAYDIAKAMSKDYGNATIKRYITYANGLFRWAVQNRDELGRAYLADLPWRDLELDGYGKAKQTYKPLETDELFALFQLDMEPQERLLLAILITTGMRLDEAALLTWERIVTRHGVSCFGLVGDARVKNEGSMRYVPVPSVVKPLLGNGGEGRLFDYRIDKYGKAQAKASDAVMTLIRQVTQDPMKVAHSLRGNFKDFLRENGVGKEVNDFITGHGQGDVAGEYGEGPSVKKRLEVIDAVKHPWLS
jgi:integrase